jgi:hypothetical protein
MDRTIQFWMTGTRQRIVTTGMAAAPCNLIAV